MMAEDEKVTEVSMLFGLCVVPLKTKLWIGPIGLLAFVMRCCFESCKKLLLSWFKYVLKKFTFSSLFCFFFLSPARRTGGSSFAHVPAEDFQEDQTLQRL